MAFYWNRQSELSKIIRRKGAKTFKPPRHYSFAKRIQQIALSFLRLLALLLVIVFFAFVGRAFYFYLLESGYFRIAELSIEGVKEQTKEEISQVIQEEQLLKQNIFRISTESLKARLSKQMPKLTDIEVKKIYPSRLLIRARERKPVVYIAARDLYLMDDEGVIIENITHLKQDWPDLVFITGVNPKDCRLGEPINDPLLASALEVLGILKKANFNLFSEVSEINLNRPDGITILLTNGAELRISKQHIREHLPLVEAFLEQFKDTNRLKYADFRFKDQIVYAQR